jgi:hypothetical protein
MHSVCDTQSKGLLRADFIGLLDDLLQYAHRSSVVFNDEVQLEALILTLEKVLLVTRAS